MRKLLILLLLSLCTQVANAQSTGAQGYSGVPAKFFSLISAGKTSEAIDYVYNTNPWLSRNGDQAANLKAELRKLDSLVGKYSYHELLVEEKVGTRYVHLVYVVGYDRQPLRFELRLYRASGEWNCQGISFDAKLIEDAEKAANQAISKHGT